MLSEFERRAWENRAKSDEHKPEMACKVVIDDIERGTIKAEHVIVIVVEDRGEQEGIHVYQSGRLSTLAAEGAIWRAIYILDDN